MGIYWRSNSDWHCCECTGECRNISKCRHVSDKAINTCLGSGGDTNFARVALASPADATRTLHLKWCVDEIEQTNTECWREKNRSMLNAKCKGKQNYYCLCDFVGLVRLAQATVATALHTHTHTCAARYNLIPYFGLCFCCRQNIFQTFGVHAHLSSAKRLERTNKSIFW